ncbi:hypothetical protein ACI1MP_33185 [Kitasatospora griseola]|uniref:hypothetical protein n=1 Tax=Kitasatospora griseola TaxID=2064 RepID=UPI00385568D3
MVLSGSAEAKGALPGGRMPWLPAGLGGAAGVVGGAADNQLPAAISPALLPMTVHARGPEPVPFHTEAALRSLPG